MVFIPPPLQYLHHDYQSARHSDDQVTTMVDIAIQLDRILFVDIPNTPTNDFIEPKATQGSGTEYHPAFTDFVSNDERLQSCSRPRRSRRKKKRKMDTLWQIYLPNIGIWTDGPVEKIKQNLLLPTAQREPTGILYHRYYLPQIDSNPKMEAYMDERLQTRLSSGIYSMRWSENPTPRRITDLTGYSNTTWWGWLGHGGTYYDLQGPQRVLCVIY